MNKERKEQTNKKRSHYIFVKKKINIVWCDFYNRFDGFIFVTIRLFIQLKNVFYNK